MVDARTLFVPPHCNVSGYELYRDTRRVVPVTSLRNRELVTEETEALLGNFVSRRELFPASAPVFVGRSAYASCTNQGLESLRVPGIKMKGEIGIPSLNEEQCRVVLPRPEVQFSAFLEPHISFDASLTPSIIPGRAKAEFVLDAAGADREFRAHAVLSRNKLSLRPLMSMKIVDQAGRPLRDMTGVERGVIFLEHAPHLKHLGRLAFDTVTKEPGKENFFSPALSVFSGDTRLDYRQAAERLAKAHILIGILKKQSAKFGLIRHVGHLDNVLASEDLNDAYLSDLDSSLILANDIPDKDRWGALLLRDLAGDSFRLATSFVQSAFVGIYFQALEAEPGRFSPFRHFLNGYFATENMKESVARTSEQLRQEYFSFLKANIDILGEIALGRADRLRTTGDIVPTSSLFWKIVHFQFYPNILNAAYRLYRQSSLGKASDTALAEIPYQEASQKFLQAGKLLHTAWIEELIKSNAHVSTAARRFKPVRFTE